MQLFATVVVPRLLWLWSVCRVLAVAAMCTYRIDCALGTGREVVAL